MKKQRKNNSQDEFFLRMVCSKISNANVLIVVLNPDSSDAFSSSLRVRGAISQAVTLFALIVDVKNKKIKKDIFFKHLK